MFFLKKRLSLLDTIGITASLLCAVHCALHPLLLVILPVAGLSFLISSGFEMVFWGLLRCWHSGLWPRAGVTMAAASLLGSG
ncbi:MAG: MerC domain-containing protein [Candidatus Sericytochromatia bacterium]|nr:MerC domain-containing protein [Candidatus Sericytochromatia bacterium]